MRLLVLLACFVITACASTTEVRTLALETRARAQLHLSETRTFTDRQDQLRSLAAARLSDLDGRTQLFRNDADARRQAWRIDGDARAETFYAPASARSAEQIRSVMMQAAPARPAALAGAPDLGKAMSNLAEIAAPPTAQENAAQVFAFVRAVASETEALREKADAAAQSAGRAPPAPTP